MGNCTSSPLQKERKQEEKCVRSLAGKPIVLSTKFWLDDDNDFLILVSGGDVPGLLYLFCIILEDSSDLSYRESQAIQLALRLSQRGTSLSVAEFYAWGEQMKENVGECEIGLGLPKRKAKCLIMKVKPTKESDFEYKTQAGLIQQTGIFMPDKNDELVIVFRTDAQCFMFRICLTEHNNSFSQLEIGAAYHALYLSEPADRMDEMVFLRYCAQLRDAYNLVATSLIEYNGSKVKCLAVQPSSLSFPEACRKTNYEFDIPSLPVYGNGTIQAEEKIKESGQADVYRGSMTRDCSALAVAIKVFHSTTDWGDCMQEITSLLRIPEHPNVMQILAFYENPRPAYIMKYFPDGDLRDFLDERGKGLDSNDALQLLLGIGEGLSHLHKHGLVHCDMKSPNILLEIDKDNGSITPVLIDLGLGRKMKGGSTNLQASNTKGTSFWMAPEMMENKGYSVKTDMYAMGIIMWEILTGDVPYADLEITSESEFFQHVLKNRRPNISKVPAKYHLILESLWHHDPSERPTAEQFILHLKLL